MTKVNATFSKENTISKLTISGHSGYKASGEDIVCAAVSSAVYVAVAILEQAGADFHFTEQPEAPLMELVANDASAISTAVLAGLFTTLSGIAQQYPEHVKIIK